MEISGFKIQIVDLLYRESLLAAISFSREK